MKNALPRAPERFAEPETVQDIEARRSLQAPRPLFAFPPVPFLKPPPAAERRRRHTFALSSHAVACRLLPPSLLRSFIPHPPAVVFHVRMADICHAAYAESSDVEHERSVECERAAHATEMALLAIRRHVT